MTITLMPHQVLGVSWMLEKERDEKFKGGLLCDAMGESGRLSPRNLQRP